MALTGRKLKFAAAVLAGFSNKEAAIRAGYSPATASQAGSRLVKDPEVAAHLKGEKKDANKASTAPATKPVADSPPEYVAQGFDISRVMMFSDPKEFLKAAMNDQKLDHKLRLDAAKALLPFEHQRMGEGGKKEEKDKAAEKAANKFSTTPPPPPRVRH